MNWPDYRRPVAESDDGYDEQQQRLIDALTEEQWHQALADDRARQRRLFAGGPLDRT